MSTKRSHILKQTSFLFQGKTTEEGARINRTEENIKCSYPEFSKHSSGGQTSYSAKGASEL